ncbi:nuclear transport factor 2 family protein [Arcticibacter pallidicorallinus]|nr:nuclear transport factor 2 family protein [Arcticibacter pallidicorallinus]
MRQTASLSEKADSIAAAQSKERSCGFNRFLQHPSKGLKRPSPVLPIHRWSWCSKIQFIRGSAAQRSGHCCMCFKNSFLYLYKIECWTQTAMESQILDLEAKLIAAILNSDIKLLDQLLHDELIFVNHTGMVLSKRKIWPLISAVI